MAAAMTTELALIEEEQQFQIVWSRLAFEVNASTYDQLIGRAIKRVRSLWQLGDKESNRSGEITSTICATPSGANSYSVNSSISANLDEVSMSIPFSPMTTSTPFNSNNDKKPTLQQQQQQTNHHLMKKAIDRRVIFENLNGYVNSGELLAILGPSGSGKTSLLNAICGRTDNYRGSVQLVGAGKRRMRLSIIPQKDYLIENLTVRENLLYSSKILNTDKKSDHEANIMRTIKMLNLTNCFHSTVANISGGEFKRVSIAQELLRQPDILILDEPTSGLDSLSCKNLIKSLVQLVEASRKGAMKPIAIVMTIHQPDIDLFHMFDHVYCMARGGRCIFDGHPSEVMEIVHSHAGLLPDQLPTATMSNPANLLIEIASEDLYGREPIERLAKFQLKQFEHRSHAMATKLNSAINKLAQSLASRDRPAQGKNTKSVACFNKRSSNMIIAHDKPPTDINTTNTNTSMQETGKNFSSSSLISVPSEGNLTVNMRNAAVPASSTSLSISMNEQQLQQPASSTSPSSRSSSKSSSKSLSLSRMKLVRDKRLTPKNDQTGKFWYHTCLLTKRSFTSTIRDPVLTLISLLFHLLVPFIMWTVYSKNIGSVKACPTITRELEMISMVSNNTMNKMKYMQDQLFTSIECSTMFFLSTYAFSMCSLTVAGLTFPLSMHILLKEVRNGWYGLPSFVLAKTIAGFLLEVLFPVISLMMIYVMLGMPSSYLEWRLWAIALVMALISMISHTQGLIFGALFMDSSQTAIFSASATSLPLCLLSGFTARIKQMPLLLQRLSWLSMYRYSSDTILMIRFGFDTCPCEPATDEYLRTKSPVLTDLPENIKPVFVYYLTSSSRETPTEPPPAPAFDSSSATILPETVASNSTAVVNSTIVTTIATSLNDSISAPSLVTNATDLIGKQIHPIPGVSYDLMLNETARASLIKRVESNEVDMFGRLADLMTRAFTYGRKIENCRSVRSEILTAADVPKDEYLPWMFCGLLMLLLATKLILFLIVKVKIGARV